MKVKHQTIVLILCLYPFVSLPLGFLMLSEDLADDVIIIISLGLGISALSVLSFNIIKQKLFEKPKYRPDNDKQSFYSKNRDKKLVLRYTR